LLKGSVESVAGHGKRCTCTVCDSR